MLSFTDLDEVWLVVSPHNPLKNKASLLHQNDRLHLVNLAIGEHPKIRSSNIEFKLPQPSYTSHTLAHLKEKFPEHTFALIMGEDNLMTFNKWKNYKYIIENYLIYVYPRPGCSLTEFHTDTNTIVTSAPLIEISSSFIRTAIKEKKDVRYFMSDAVWKYIDEMNFYK
jgi:nicotinate-nucleotide adenylyltransferase